jgi:hypothetical protein
MENHLCDEFYPGTSRPEQHLKPDGIRPQIEPLKATVMIVLTVSRFT